jgi:hypothetical protein
MKKLPAKFQVWVDARQRHRLSHAQIQMARELGLNPTKFGSLANHKQEPWKVPLPQFIEELYFQRFGKHCPDTVSSIEDMVMCKKEKKLAKREQQSEQRVPDQRQTDDTQSISPVR